MRLEFDVPPTPMQPLSRGVTISGFASAPRSARGTHVAPDTCISPYEKTLNSAGVAERRAWAENARRQLAPSLIGRRRVVIFAGQRYREFLVPALLSDGYEVDVPMANLGIGEQLAWLAARS